MRRFRSLLDGPHAAEWDALGLGVLTVAFNPSAHVASHRATTSSRTPGKVNRGTVYATAFEHDPAHFHVCPCGCPQTLCPDCLSYICRAPGHAPHVCRSGW